MTRSLVLTVKALLSLAGYTTVLTSVDEGLVMHNRFRCAVSLAEKYSNFLCRRLAYTTFWILGSFCESYCL
jgi:hypothetical protein